MTHWYVILSVGGGGGQHDLAVRDLLLERRDLRGIRLRLQLLGGRGGGDRFHATAVVSAASELFRLFSNYEFEMLKCDNYSRI